MRKGYNMKIICLLFFIFLVQAAIAQNPQTAKLKLKLSQAKDDTAKVLLLSDISASYRYSKFDSSLWYGRKGLQLARRIHYVKGEGRCMANVARILSEQGNTAVALKWNLQALHLNEESKDWYGKVQTLNSMGLMFLVLRNYTEALTYFFQTKKIYDEKQVADDWGLIACLNNVGVIYLYANRLDSAEKYLFQSFEGLKHSQYIHGSLGNPTSFVVREIGRLQEKLGHDKDALHYYRQSIVEAQVENDLRGITMSYQYLSDWFKKNNQPDSSIYYAGKALQTAKSLPLASGILRASARLTELYKMRGNKDSTLKYMTFELAAKDSLFNPEKIRQIEILNFTEQQRLQQIEEEYDRVYNRVKVYGLLIGVAILLFSSFILWRSNRQQKKANKLLQQQRNQISKNLNELKITQTQLIQSEKMASLGELTAGIAHEIQNPLNFVNNFSEVSMELIEEVRSEKLKAKSERSEELENELLDDITENLQKISHHGKRADSIVKGMLQHSRASSNTKELTDINKLADEYFRLAYHGLRAKDKSFNAELITDFDASLPLVFMVPQDIGRVLLNLFTNAFYATQQRQKLEEGYRPEVRLSTAKNGDFIEVKVRDNGTGIPDTVKDKILQPFFTTKPTGEGTGLGLSLSYDIVVKGHGGKIDIDTKEGEYTEVTISIPA
ncbi:MAG: tetratricopeptide repeat-containing sensor histidine kinase [Daejeonella sp.]